MKTKLLIFTIGAIVGALAASSYWKSRQYEFIDEEDEDELFTEKVRDRLNSLEKFGAASMDLNGREPETKVLVMNKDRYKKIARNYNSSVNIVEEVDPIMVNNNPHLISIDEFSEDDSENEKITVYYYRKNNVLVDEDDEVIDEIVEVLGSDFDIKGYDVVYVRNNGLSIDYEVVLQNESYIKE